MLFVRSVVVYFLGRPGVFCEADFSAPNRKLPSHAAHVTIVRGHNSCSQLYAVALGRLDWTLDNGGLWLASWKI